MIVVQGYARQHPDDMAAACDCGLDGHADPPRERLH